MFDIVFRKKVSHVVTEIFKCRDIPSIPLTLSLPRLSYPNFLVQHVMKDTKQMLDCFIICKQLQEESC